MKNVKKAKFFFINHVTHPHCENFWMGLNLCIIFKISFCSFVIPQYHRHQYFVDREWIAYMKSWNWEYTLTVHIKVVQFIYRFDTNSVEYKWILNRKSHSLILTTCASPCDGIYHDFFFIQKSVNKISSNYKSVSRRFSEFFLFCFVQASAGNYLIS